MAATEISEVYDNFDLAVGTAILRLVQDPETGAELATPLDVPVTVLTFTDVEGGVQRHRSFRLQERTLKMLRDATSPVAVAREIPGNGRLPDDLRGPRTRFG